MTTVSSEEKIHAQLPKRAMCVFDVPMIGISKHASHRVRVSYKQYFTYGSSERQAYRHLKEFIRDELKTNPQEELQT